MLRHWSQFVPNISTDIIILLPLTYIIQVKVDTLHTHLLQVGAAVHIGTAALSYMALRFSSSDHKKAVLISRIAVS